MPDERIVTSSEGWETLLRLTEAELQYLRDAGVITEEREGG